MKHAAGNVFAACLIVLVVPYIMTMIINGRKQEIESRLNSLSTGRDVLICDNNDNRLIDVEQFVAAVLPGEVEPNSGTELLEAQAVAVRTKIYYAMGENTVIAATDFDFQYYDDAAYINRWGQENYQTIKNIYEQAVINTAGQIIK